MRIGLYVFIFQNYINETSLTVLFILIFFFESVFKIEHKKTGTFLKIPVSISSGNFPLLKWENFILTNVFNDLLWIFSIVHRIKNQFRIGWHIK